MTAPASAPTVLVLAVGGNVSQGILKALARSRFHCRVVGADIGPDHMGLFTVDKACVSPWAHEAAFIPWLIACCRRESVDLVLSGAEPVLMALAKHRDTVERETGSRCLVSDLAVMETCDDKWKTCGWLTRNDFACPPSAPTDAQDAIDELVARHGYPLIAKPRRGGGARGHFPVANEADLAYVRQKPDYLIQQYIGQLEDEYTVGCFVDREGRMAESCCMRRDLVAGTTFRAWLGEFPEIREEAERIVAALRPVGPCNVQLRMTGDGPVCLEINPRFSGTTPIRAHFGYNEAEAAIAHFLFNEPVNLPRVTQGVALRYWNELYVAQSAVDTLRDAGVLESPQKYGVHIERFGDPV